jgi:cobalt-zinc-cadmium efflux system outer membrane protein
MAFYDLYQSNRALGVMRETLRLLQDARRAAESMDRVGDGRQSDVLRAQVEIARMTEDTLRMVAMSRTMAARLDALLDRAADPAAGVPVLPPFPGLPDAESLEQVALARRPMLRAGAQEVAGAERMQRLARKELLPDLTVGVQYGQRGTAAGDGAMGAEAGRRTERMGSLMLGATLPVFAGRRQLRARDEALAMRAMAEADLRAMRSDTRGRIRGGVATLERARRLQVLYRGTVLPQADASAHSALAAYRGGQVDFMALLDARMTVNRYRLELHALEAEEGKAWAELEMLTGGELVDADARREEDP